LRGRTGGDIKGGWVTASTGHSQQLYTMAAVQMRTPLVTVIRQLWGCHLVVSHTQEWNSQAGNHIGRGESGHRH